MLDVGDVRALRLRGRDRGQLKAHEGDEDGKYLEEAHLAKHRLIIVATANSSKSKR